MKKNLNVTVVVNARGNETFVCKGCGSAYRNARGVRAHQSTRFITLACKPQMVEETRVYA